MPTALPSGTPLHLTAATLQATLDYTEGLRLQRIDDGRLLVQSTPYQESRWVTPDLACLCSTEDTWCCDQVVAAIVLGHPFTTAADVTPALLDSVRGRIHRAVTPDGPLPASHFSRLKNDSELFFDIRRRLTDPAQTPESLVAELDRHPDFAYLLLQLSAPHRPGPLREAIWDRWFTGPAPAAVSAAPSEGVIVLRHLLTAESDESLARRLPALLPAAIPTLGELLATDPAFALRLRPLLTAPQLAALLSRLRRHEARLALGRTLARPVSPPTPPGTPVEFMAPASPSRRR